MNIGTVSRELGVPQQTIRYYESVGLVTPVRREPNGYRRYSTIEVETLRFIHRGRGLGFSIAEVRELLALWRERGRASADVKSIALARLDEIDGKVRELASLKASLLDLMDRCQGDDRPDCPVIDDLTGASGHSRDATADRGSSILPLRSRLSKRGNRHD